MCFLVLPFVDLLSYKVKQVCMYALIHKYCSIFSIPETSDFVPTSRIVGGTTIKSRHKYPWYVGLHHAYLPDSVCGGSIINVQYIPTAAHCIAGYCQFLSVSIADYNQHSAADDVRGVTRLAQIDRCIFHDNYDSRTMDNGIGLIRLKEKLSLTANEDLRSVYLPESRKNTYEGILGTVYGWGRLGSGGPVPDVLQEVSLPILGKACTGRVIAGSMITSQMMCAGVTEGGKNSCQGDSGGPLTVEEKGKTVIVGLVSFGDSCSLPGSPGVYTRVSEYLDWISKNTDDAHNVSSMNGKPYVFPLRTNDKVCKINSMIPHTCTLHIDIPCKYFIYMIIVTSSFFIIEFINEYLISIPNLHRVFR